MKASKREAPSKMRFPAEMRRLLEDDQVDRPGVHGGRPLQPTGPNSQAA